MLITCSCGNKDQRKFNKYIKTLLTEDERGRKHLEKAAAVLCGICLADITWAEFGEQFKNLTKTKT